MKVSSRLLFEAQLYYLTKLYCRHSTVLPGNQQCGEERNTTNLIVPVTYHNNNVISYYKCSLIVQNVTSSYLQTSQRR